MDQGVRNSDFSENFEFVLNRVIVKTPYPASKYMFKVANKDTQFMCSVFY